MDTWRNIHCIQLAAVNMVLPHRVMITAACCDMMLVEQMASGEDIISCACSISYMIKAVMYSMHICDDRMEVLNGHCHPILRMMGDSHRG